MAEKKFAMTTKKGYDFFEVSSAMQKSIRRGLEEDAIYWAYELYRSNYEKYVWKRLLIIAVEDIGMGDPQVMMLVNSLHYNYKVLTESKSPEAMRPMMAAVLLMCRAGKSQLFNWVYGLIDFHESHNKDIPEYAIDQHTLRGKMKGSNINNFFEKGRLISNAKPWDVEGYKTEEEYLERAMDFHKRKKEGEELWDFKELPEGHKDKRLDEDGQPLFNFGKQEGVTHNRKKIERKSRRRGRSPSGAEE